MAEVDELKGQLAEVLRRLKLAESQISESQRKEHEALEKLEIAQQRLGGIASQTSQHGENSLGDHSGTSEPNATPVYLSSRRLDVFRGRPKTSSDISVQEWIGEMKAYVDVRPLSTIQKAALVMQHLSGCARQEVQGRGPSTTRDPEEIFRVLAKVFGDGDSVGQIRSHFYGYRQKPGEDVLSCSLELVGLYNRLEELDGIVATDRDKVLRERLAEAVTDEGLRRELRRLNMDSPTLDFFEARDRALQWMGSSSKSDPVKKVCNQETPVVTQPTAETLFQEHSKLLKDLIKEVKDLKQGSSVHASEPRGLGARSFSGSRRRRMPCFICQSLDHLKRDCPQRRGGRASTTPTTTEGVIQQRSEN